jgi:hypothetical protein
MFSNVLPSFPRNCHLRRKVPRAKIILYSLVFGGAPSTFHVFFGAPLYALFNASLYQSPQKTSFSGGQGGCDRGGEVMPISAPWLSQISL